MKWIKFTFSNKHEITLSQDVAERIFDNGQKIVRIYDDITGKWTGETINLAFLVSTEDAGEYNHIQNLKGRFSSLPEEDKPKYLAEINKLQLHDGN